MVLAYHKWRRNSTGKMNINSFDSLRGFICGLYAGNYDISHIFIDDLYKVAGNRDDRAVDK